MTFLRAEKNNIAITLFLICLFALVSALQYKYDGIVRPQKSTFTTETRYVMPSTLVKKLSFGFDNVLADFYWISLIQDFSIWNGKDSFYLDQYKNLSVLDPDFSYPYLLGILTFTARGVNYKENAGYYPADIRSFEPIANIGMKNMPDNWEIPFYLGTAFQLNKVPDKALPYLKIATQKPDAPDAVKNVYQTYLKNILTGTDANTLLIKIIYDTTTSKTTREIVEEGLLTKALSTALTLVVEDYKTKYGEYPISIDELIAKKMVSESTDLKRNYTISINQTTGEVKVISK